MSQHAKTWGMASARYMHSASSSLKTTRIKMISGDIHWCDSACMWTNWIFKRATMRNKTFQVLIWDVLWENGLESQLTHLSNNLSIKVHISNIKSDLCALTLYIQPTVRGLFEYECKKLHNLTSHICYDKMSYLSGNNYLPHLNWH